jgi:hypothetical protein
MGAEQSFGPGERAFGGICILGDDGVVRTVEKLFHGIRDCEVWLQCRERRRLRLLQVYPARHRPLDERMSSLLGRNPPAWRCNPLDGDVG